MKKSKFLVLILMISVLSVFVFSACNPDSGRVPEAENLAYKKVAMATEGLNDSLSDTDNFAAYTAFSAKLINALYKSRENVLVSPLSIYLALAMTANAADGDTLSGMATALGLSVTDLNAFCGYLYAYFMETDLKEYVSVANSIWCNKNEVDFTPKEEFLQTNATYYGADVFKTGFDSQTVAQINQWVGDKTDGMIKKLLEDDIDKDAIAFLINTLLVDSKWDQDDFYDFDMNFTDANGIVSVRKFLNANVSYEYMKTANAVALTSRLKGGLRFVGILPNGTLDEYMANLNGTELLHILTNKDQTKDVLGYFPTFDFDYSAKLNDTLMDFGMNLAFDPMLADFTKGFNMPTDGVVYIDEVLHKTKIEVTKYGVRAAAATSVQMNKATSAAPKEKITITLDRPFMFAIIDSQYNIPLFVGAYNG